MDRTWRIPHKKLELSRITKAVQSVVTGTANLTVEVEKEDSDTVTAFFKVAHDGKTIDLEISVYDCGGDGIILSLEGDSADNFGYWDDASQLAEDLADELEARPVEL